jgi:hypothetical protein
MSDTPPVGCDAQPCKTSDSWWMNQDQYDAIACVCQLDAAHEGPHQCAHGGFD